MNKIIGSALLLAIGFTSCTKDNSVTPAPTNNLTIPYNTLTASSNYLETFKGTDGKTSVDFSGQTTRIEMLKELDTYIKTGTTAAINEQKMKDMFENKNTPFTSNDLNTATTKVIVSKSAASFSAVDADAERQHFYNYFKELERISKLNGQTATQGNAGLLGGKRLVDEKGFEYAQFVQKGLIGAMMLDQISNVYLGTEKQAADNKTIVDGKNYTAMQHHWDEAYGYLTSNPTYPMKDPNDATKYLESFLGGYVRQVGTSVGGDPEAVYVAFLKGRAAIVNNDLTTRDEQITYIRTALEKAVATVAISYLNQTKTASDDASKFHALSEGYGFIYSLRFAYNAKIDKTKSDNLLNILGGKANGFWSLTNADIDNVRDQIATAFGIDKNAVVSH
ncbi:MAG: DUF4856 domain-containing protein [Flavipsychrobacter sp.]